MSACTKSEGYRCEFIDSVIDIFYCKKCSLVARNITITSCCGESYCHACIADIHQQGKPCPECGEKGFNTYDQLKYQRRIKALKAYCSMKERGCGWSGILEQLDTHLDPDQDNCQYVDTECPLNCNVTIPKNKVEQHVVEECSRRPYVCQHCNFEATYEEVVNKHLPECKYVPLNCPNRCGVACERENMEDHMKICRLEEIMCKFVNIGCKECFNREDQEEHMRQSSQEHLILTASLAMETKERLEKKILEQDKKLKEAEEKWKKVKEHERKSLEQEKKLTQQNYKLLYDQFETKLLDHSKQLKEMEEKWKKKMEEQEQKLAEQDQKLKEQEVNIKVLSAHKKEVEEKFIEDKKIWMELFAELFSWCYKARDNLQTAKFKFQGQSYPLKCCIDAIKDFPSLKDTLSILSKECPICFALYLPAEMITMPGCTDCFCKSCFEGYLTDVVKNQEVKDYNCPVCNMPNMENRKAAKKYFQCLIPLARKHLDPTVYHTMWTKVTQFNLVTNPDFYWCANCSNGFSFKTDVSLAPQGIKCPKCFKMMCFKCKKPWEIQHESLKCEEYTQWRLNSKPDLLERGLAAYLSENGIECPSCHMNYDLSKSSCMCFTCTHCCTVFCSGCSMPMKGKQCGKFKLCETKDLHGHHPRDCLIYLRDFDVTQLQHFLHQNHIEFVTMSPEEMNSKKTFTYLYQLSVKLLRCRVKLHNRGGLRHDCGGQIEYAGLCKIHYKEYLVDKINKNKLDPVTMYSLDKIKCMLEREEMEVPEIDKRNRETEKQYKERLIKHVKEVLPLLHQP